MKNRYMKLPVVVAIAVALLGLVFIFTAPAGAADLKKLPPISSDKAGYVEGRVLIMLKEGASISELESSFCELSTSDRKVSIKNVREFERISDKTKKKCILIQSPSHTTQELLRQFREDPAVETVEPDYIMHISQVIPDDEYFDQLWGLHNTGQEVNGTTGTPDADIDAPEAWERSTGSSDVIAVVLDTGVDYTHADLQDNMWVNQLEAEGDPGVDDDGNNYVDDIYGIDAYNDDCDPYDDNRHGTHVSGIIAARGNNETGITGVTWNTRIMALKFLSAGGSGPTSAAIECIEYVIAMKQRGENVVVINASWGSSSESDLLNVAISAAADNGIIMAAGSGNSSLDMDGPKPFYPAATDLPSIVAVAATNQDDDLAYFSNYGASNTDLAAPGVNILSAVPGGGYEPGPFDFFFDDMESGDAKWDMVATDSPWAITEENPYEDDYAWSDSPGGDYGASINLSVVSKTLDLSGQEGHLMLGFWLWQDLDPWVAPCGKKDTLTVEVSGDDGVSWDSLAEFCGNDPSWKLHAYLIPESVRTVTFRFRFRLSTNPFYHSDGVYIDNVGIGQGTGMGSYEYLKGTSMATPFVTGAISLVSVLYPGDDIYTRINRIFSGVDKIESMSGIVATDGRLNLDLATGPDLDLAPLIVRFEEISDRTIRVEGMLFGDTQGKVLFHDKYDLNNTMEGAVQSWTDTEIVVTKPKYSGDYYWVEDSTGQRSNRKRYRFSMWEQMAESFYERDSATATALNGKIYIFGGFAGGNDSLRSWEWYTPEDGNWHHIYGNWMKKRRAHLTCAPLDGKIYIIGGYTTGIDECLDTVTRFDPEPPYNNFTYVEPLPVAMCFMRAAELNGKIYVTGGMDNDDNFLSTVYEYDPVQNTWTPKASMSVPRFEHGSVAVNGKIYAFGGLSTWDPEETYHTSGEIYNPATDTWSPMADMPVGLARFGAATDGRYIYAAGGTNDDFWYTHLDIVLRYDTETDTWTSLAERMLLTPKVTAPAVYIDGYGLYSTNGGHYSEESGPFGPYYEGMTELEFLAADKLSDADGDGIPDADDNCRLTCNPEQQDTDGDGFGNICDCDLNNDCVVNTTDLRILKSVWQSTGPGLDADFNSDEKVDRLDYRIYRSRYGKICPFE